MPSVSDNDSMLADATDRIVDILQSRLRKGILGEGVWKSIHKLGALVVVVRLPEGFVALDVNMSVDTEWTEHIKGEIT